MPDSSENSWKMLRGYEPFSLCDWPGMISAVLFFGGCNLRCPTCHNALLARHPEKLHALNKDNILAGIAKNRKWLDGLVLTGGETTILPGINLILQDLLKTGLPLKLDTNGLRPDVIKTSLNIEQLLMIAVDIKGPWDKYPLLSGGAVSANQARQCIGEILEMAGSRPERFMFRCTRVPGLTVRDIEIVRTYLPEGFELKLQDYMPRGRNITSKQN